jgi:hypothetical protein
MTADTPGDETEVERAARQLRDVAGRAAEGATLVERSVAEANWAGPMRDRFAAESEAQRSAVTRDAHELLDLAAKLDGHAQWIRDEKSRLEGLQTRIGAWMGANPVGSSPDGNDASLVLVVPNRHDYAWEEVAASLRARGVVF